MTEKPIDDSKKPILDEIASIQSDIYKDYIGNVALNADKVLRSEAGGKGIELYEDLLRDFEVRAVFQTRKLAVISKEWEVIPASDAASDIKIADFVKQVLGNISYDDARNALLSGIILGYKPAEIMWEYSEGDVWIKEIIGRAARRFVFDLQGNLRLLTLRNMIEGEALPERKFIVFRNVSNNGSYYGDGLGSSLYWPVWFRKNSIKFWLIFQDKYGSPTAIGKYPPGTIKEQQDALLQAIAAIQQESAIKIPDTMVIELLEATRSGTINSYEIFCSYMDKTISKLILGHEAATHSTPGRLGNEKQADEIRRDFIKADADALCECQNRTLIRWIVDYNFPNVKAYPKVWIRTDEEKDLKPLAERDQILTKGIGLPITKKYFYETYGIPQPQAGEELVTVTATPFVGTTANQGNQGFSEFKNRCPVCFSDNTQGIIPDQHTVDGMINKILPQASQALAENEKKILDAIQSSASYEEAMAKVRGLFPQLDMGKIQDLLERAMFNGAIFGGYVVGVNNPVSGRGHR